MRTIHFSESEAHVVEVLKRNPGITVADLVAQSHQSRSTVRNALIKVEASNHLIVNPAWPRRYTWLDMPISETVPEEPAPAPVVAPDTFPAAEFGKRLTAGRPKIVKVLEGIDPKRHDRDRVMKDLEAVGRAVLGLYVALSQVEDGPEWRKEAGV